MESLCVSELTAYLPEVTHIEEEQWKHCKTAKMVLLRITTVNSFLSPLLRLTEGHSEKGYGRMYGVTKFLKTLALTPYHGHKVLVCGNFSQLFIWLYQPVFHHLFAQRVFV